MVPIEKVKDIISKHDALEKELSSGNIDPKKFAIKSKEYSNLGEIIKIAREYLNLESEKRDLVNLAQDKTNEKEIIDLAQKDLNQLVEKKNNFGSMLPEESSFSRLSCLDIMSFTLLIGTIIRL